MPEPKNRAAVELGKLRAQKGPSLNEVGRLGGKARAKKLSARERRDIASLAGSAGGPARAKKLSAKRRAEIARAAARARWQGKREKEGQ